MADMEVQNLNELLQIRRDKLKELQEAGRDPFVITKYDVTHHSADDLQGVVDVYGFFRFVDHGVSFRLDDFGNRFNRSCYCGFGFVYELLVLSDHILLADFLEAIVGAFQQVSQHLLH